MLDVRAPAPPSCLFCAFLSLCQVWRRCFSNRVSFWKKIDNIKILTFFCFANLFNVATAFFRVQLCTFSRYLWTLLKCQRRKSQVFCTFFAKMTYLEKNRKMCWKNRWCLWHPLCIVFAHFESCFAGKLPILESSRKLSIYSNPHLFSHPFLFEPCVSHHWAKIRLCSKR